jgi:DNA-binding CsgD family transcriptional regulator
MAFSNLTREDHEEIHLFCRDLFAMERVDEIRKESLLFFESRLGAEKGNFFMAEAPDKPVSFLNIVNRGIEEAALHRYRRYYWRIDPFYKKYQGRNPLEISDVLTTEDIVSYKNFTRTEYYNDFLKPQSIHHQMTIHLKAGRQVLGVVALFRGRRAPRFSHHDKLTALSAAPYVSGALQAAVSSEKNRTLASAMQAIVSGLPYRGLVILDRFLEPVYTDERAAGVLSALVASKGRGNSYSMGLPREIYRGCNRLAGSLEGNEEEACRETRFDLFAQGSRQKVSVTLRLVLEPKIGPLYLVFLDPEAHTLCRNRELRGAGLTRRETEVVHLLAKGSKNAEIAEALFISPYTVENHLRSVYRKMGVSNRTAVLHRLLQIDP